MSGPQEKVRCSGCQKTELDCKVAVECGQSRKVRHWFCGSPGRLIAVGACRTHWKDKCPGKSRRLYLGGAMGYSRDAASLPKAYDGLFSHMAMFRGTKTFSICGPVEAVWSLGCTL